MSGITFFVTLNHKATKYVDAKRKEGGTEWDDLQRRRPDEHKGETDRSFYDKIVTKRYKTAEAQLAALENFKFERALQTHRRSKRIKRGFENVILSMDNGIDDFVHPFMKMNIKNHYNIYIIVKEVQEELKKVKLVICFVQPILTVERRRQLRTYEFQRETEYDSEKEDKAYSAFAKSKSWDPEEGHIFICRNFKNNDYDVDDDDDDDNNSVVSTLTKCCEHDNFW